GLRLAFQKGHLAARTWWAQVGSNHRLLACKAENGQEYAQLPGPVHAGELRKPCPEMPWGAWGSLHGGSRKWFPGPTPREHRPSRRVTGAMKDSADQVHTQ